MRVKYSLAKIVVILITILWFLYDYKDFSSALKEEKVASILILIFTALLVHVLKAGRLYLALYGTRRKLRTYLKKYCIVTPVTIILPFKIGELFRMHYYGSQIGNVLKGIVIIFLDRFMDTLALVTTILFVRVFNGGNLTPFIYLLLIFLVLIVVAYLVFPEFYTFWKDYLLKAKASKNKLVILGMLDILGKVYKEIENVVKGCGIILYLMSVTAWSVEIGSLVILGGIRNENNLNQVISTYLVSAMGGVSSIELKRFVFASLVGFILIYLILKIYELVARKKEKCEDNCCI